MLPPHGGYPSTRIGVAVMGMYNGTKRVARSADFLKYFLTDDYFNQMVADANGLPIQSLAFKNESFAHPPRWTNEWNFHEGFAQALSTWCTPSECGPILLILDVNRAEQREFGGWEVRHYTAREAWERFNTALQERIRVRTSGSPQLLEKYKALMKRQAEIDALKARGEKIPEEWISNPFLKRYYRDTGRLASK
ncbi:MAG: hypothetical protein JNM63_15400, partial [Spirochaetia bacterium]|nr:hypothetical protein [Spirochaetia bacterium]